MSRTLHGGDEGDALEVGEGRWRTAVGETCRSPGLVPVDIGLGLDGSCSVWRCRGGGVEGRGGEAGGESCGVEESSASLAGTALTSTTPPAPGEGPAASASATHEASPPPCNLKSACNNGLRLHATKYDSV